jgi:hypothetical protein
MSIVVRDIAELSAMKPHHIENLFKRLLSVDWQDAKARGTRVRVRPKDGETACAGRCEAFFGYIIGKYNGNSDFRINDYYGTTRYISPSDLFSLRVIEEQKYKMSLNKIIREAELLLLEMLTENDRPFGEPLLQCNLNLYTANSSNKPHRDDLDARAATFHPASVTCILAVHKVVPHFELYAASTGPDGKPTERIVAEGRDVPDFVGSGVGRLFGLCGDDYLFGKHKARTGWETSSPEAFERMSLNFRFVRREAWNKLQENAE